MLLSSRGHRQLLPHSRPSSLVLPGCPPLAAAGKGRVKSSQGFIVCPCRRLAPRGCPIHGMAGLSFTIWVSHTQGVGVALHQGAVSLAFGMLTLVLMNKEGERPLPRAGQA